MSSTEQKALEEFLQITCHRIWLVKVGLYETRDILLKRR